MEISKEKIEELQEHILTLESKRWKNNLRINNHERFMDLTSEIIYMFKTCEFLGIDIGIRRAGMYFKLIEDKQNVK